MLEQIGSFITQQVFGCNAVDFKRGYLRYNAHLATWGNDDPNGTSRRDRAIIDQTAKALYQSSAHSWSSSSSSSTAHVVIDPADVKRKILRQNDSLRESKRQASERIAKQLGESGGGSTPSSAEPFTTKHSPNDPKDAIVRSPTFTPSKSPSPVKEVKVKDP